jgi:hypothetical protein
MCGVSRPSSRRTGVRDGQPVGEVTSAAPLADGCVGLVRIAWRPSAPG